MVIDKIMIMTEKFQESGGLNVYVFPLLSSWVLEFAIVIVYLIIILSITIKYSVIKLIQTLW